MSQVVTFEGYVPPARFDDISWTQAQIEEAATVTGSWTVIDTIDLSPADSDPANPLVRNFTTENGTGPGLWYRITFLDGSGGVSTTTDPVRNSDAGPPPRYATADDFAARIGLDLTDDERVRAETLLEQAAGIVEDEVKRGPLVLVENETITMPGTTDEAIELPSTPVISVSQVLLAGEQLTENEDWYLDGNKIVRMPVTRAIIIDALADDMSAFPLGTAGFGWPEQTLSITYTHGYADLPSKVTQICLEMVVRVWVNPGSVARETNGDSSVVYDNMRFSPTGMQITDDERKSLKRLFGATMKSVTVGR